MFQYNLEKIENVHPLFQALENCKGVEQKDEHHPEGDVFIHSLQTLMLALRESDDIDLILAAMLHDVGKVVHSHGHEKYSVDLLRGLISEKTKFLILNHMRVWDLINGQMKKRKKIESLYTHEWFPELILLARWDRMARQPHWFPKYDRVETIETLKRRIVKMYQCKNCIWWGYAGYPENCNNEKSRDFSFPVAQDHSCDEYEPIIKSDE